MFVIKNSMSLLQLNKQLLSILFLKLSITVFTGKGLNIYIFYLSIPVLICKPNAQTPNRATSQKSSFMQPYSSISVNVTNNQEIQRTHSLNYVWFIDAVM